MTEDATPEADPTSPESAPVVPPTAEEVWEKTVSASPITAEDVSGEEPAEEPKERSLVAPQIAAALAKDAPAIPDALAERLSAIEAMLKPAAEPVAATIEAEVAGLKEIILSQQADAAAAAATIEDDARWSLLKDGVVSNIRDAKDRYPLLVGLHQEENVYNELRLQLAEGKTVSEDDIASQAELKLQAAFDAMQLAKGVLDATPSQDPEPSQPTPPSTTLSPTLSSGDATADVETLLVKNKGDTRQVAAELWDSIMEG